MRNVSDKSCRENQNTFYFQHIISENREVRGKKCGGASMVTDNNTIGVLSY